MPGSARIMKLRIEEVNGVKRAIELHAALRGALRVSAIALTLVLLVGCSSEKRADRLLRDADRVAAKGDNAAAVASLEKLLRDYPNTAAAGQAREKIKLYSGLVDAVERFPQRRAREIVVAVARALERHRVARGALPERLEQLVPEFLDTAAVDPWGGKLLYERTGRAAYRLISLGQDAVRGGEGDAADLVVVDGRFTEDINP